MHTIILVLLILSYKVQSTPITICSSKKGSNLVQGNFRQPRNFSIASTYRVLFQCRSQRGLSVSGLNRINYNLDSSIILLYIYTLRGKETVPAVCHHTGQCLPGTHGGWDVPGSCGNTQDSRAGPGTQGHPTLSQELQPGAPESPSPRQQAAL